MSSSGSIRDLNRALTSFLAAPVLPLPDDLLPVLDAFVGKNGTEYSQSVSDRLNDSLLSIFAKHVHGHPPASYVAFLAVLKRVRAAIRSPAHVLQWWDRLVEPTLDFIGEERSLSAGGTAVEDLAGVLARENDEDEATEADQAVVLRLLQKWMDGVPAADAAGSAWAIAGRHGTDAVKTQLVQDVIVACGKIRPSDLYDGLDHFFVQAEYRSRAILLFTEFVRSQPPHLHAVCKMPLFDNLLRCLQHDTSTTVVSLALTLLVMLLPHMPVSIVPVLPTLFNIYVRLLFWDPAESAATSVTAATTAAAVPWDKCVYAPERDSPNVHHLLSYFTVLYGLYPINFMDYIRKPHRYLRHANVADTDEVEVQPSEVRDRSETFRRCHLLHPNFYNLTIESERTDFSRWMNCATADIASECISLYVPPQEPPSVASGGVEAQHDTVLGGEAQRRSSQQSSLMSGSCRRRSGLDSPTLPPMVALPSHDSRTELRDMIESNRAIKSGIYQSLASDSVPSLSLSHQETLPERPAPGTKEARPTPHPLHGEEAQTGADVDADADAGADADADVKGNAAAPDDNDGHDASMEQLRRQILLLRNDLNFERYMGQQHLAHIGALRQRSMLQAVTEAETQNLILANRTLKHRLEEAKKTEAQVRKEADMSRNRAKAWEATLSDKLRKLRDEAKTWTAEGARLRSALAAAQADNAQLVTEVCAAELRELKTRQAMQLLKTTADKTAQLQATLQAQMAEQWSGEPLAAQLARAHDETAERERQLERLCLELEAREAEMARMRAFYQKQVAELRAKLASVLQRGQQPGAATGPSTTALDEARAMVDSALAASRAKYLELQKSHTRLMRKYKVLESRSLEQATAMYYEGGSGGPEHSGGAMDAAPSTLSDPETESSSGLNNDSSQRGGMRASLEGSCSIGSVGSGGGSTPRPPPTSMVLDAAVPGRYGRRPSTPPPGTQGPASPGSVSPQAERYYGRGGFQNSGRKDKKDKKPDDAGDKKGKKSSGGIRVVRGFV